MNSESESDALEKQELPVGLFLGALQRVELRGDPLHVLLCKLNRRQFDLQPTYEIKL